MKAARPEMGFTLHYPGGDRPPANAVPAHPAFLAFMERNSKRAGAWSDTANAYTKLAKTGAADEATRQLLAKLAARANNRADAILRVIMRGVNHIAARAQSAPRAATRIERGEMVNIACTPSGETLVWPTLIDPTTEHTVPGEYVAPNNAFDRTSQALFSAQFKPLVGDDLASLPVNEARPSPRLHTTHGRAA